jgi:hypothetical protein
MQKELQAGDQRSILSPFIRKYLKTAVASGELVQTKGNGASVSSKLTAAKTEKLPVPTAPARGRTASPPKAKKQSAAKVKKAKAPKKSCFEVYREEEARFASRD